MERKRWGRVGLGIEMTDDGTKLYGEGIDNLKNEIRNEIISYLEEEIIKNQNEQIRRELNDLKEAFKKKDRTLMQKAIQKLVDFGASYIISKIIDLILTGV